MKVIHPNSFNELICKGHCVPRKPNFDNITDGNHYVCFRVGREYTVTTPDKTKTVKVKCTQNTPYHIRLTGNTTE